jgi:hypothetical protein
VSFATTDATSSPPASDGPGPGPLARYRLARRLMDEFAIDTGIEGGAPPRRYLWTDAFAVCNFLGLHRESGEGRDLDLALRLVDQVHHVLGRHRPDDARHGWLSGLAEPEGERHPTRGGLRIGKPLPERRQDEPFDAEREWDRDGQYLHYLTQWMHALRRAGQETGQATFHHWAVELAKTAHAAFTRAGSAAAPPRMAWKMSLDLRRPLVPSMGQHDPLDAWLVDLELAADGAAAGEPTELERETAEAAALCAGAPWESDDPLGIGALALATVRLVHLVLRHGVDDRGLLRPLVAATRRSLERLARGDPFAAPAASRLAFRELGLALGLHGLARLGPPADLPRAVRDDLAALVRHAALASRIDGFWSGEAARRNRTWSAHGDINSVMLATSLCPAGYLGPDSGRAGGAEFASATSG